MVLVCFGQENQLFPRKKIVLGRKTNFFLGKTKKNKKHLLRHYAARLQKKCFFVFPRKKMVLDRKTNFFLGKSWFFCPKPSFS